MTIELSLNSAAGPYTDYSDWADLSNLRREISLNSDNDPQRSTSGEIELYGDGYDFVKTNLIDSVNLYSNSIYAKITETECGTDVFLYKFETENLKWCDDNECRISFSMETYSEDFECIKNTLIADNTSGEFQEYPVSGNPHPRFRYCDVFKPTFAFGILITIANAIDIIFVLVIAIITLINSIASSLGFPTITPPPSLASLLSGCERGFPAPLIRNYIGNACSVCSLTVNASSAPIWFDTVDPLNALASNLYYDSCLLTAYTKKGVAMSGTKDWIENNKPSWTLFDAMSKLKKPWNARWYYRGGTLYCHRKDLLSGLMYGSTYGLDFTGSDYANVVDNICFSWNGQGKPRRIYMKWGTDATDNIGNQLLNRFNGEYLNLSGNPNYKADVEVDMLEFGASSFVLDGDDSIYDANLVNSIGSVFTSTSYKYCLKTQGDTCSIAKIIVWDGIDATDARPIRALWSTYTGCVEFLDDDGAFFPVTTGDLRHCNYPMSFSPCQETTVAGTNLWRYWSIDVPSSGKKTNIGFEFKLKYCCAYNALDLYMRVLFADGVTEGEINFISFDNSTREITIKGNLV